MRFRALTAAALFAATTQLCAAAELGNTSGHERERAVMLYFSKSFGADTPARQKPFSFGLRLQQSSSFSNAARIDLVDLNFTNRLQARLLNGTLRLDAFGRKNPDGKSSSEESSEDPEESSERHLGKIVTISIVGAAGIACALEWGICKGHDGERSTADPPGPVTPGGPG